MKQKYTKARKANKKCSAPYYSFLHNAPVAVRRAAGCLGADHFSFDRKHGILASFNRQGQL